MSPPRHRICAPRQRPLIQCSMTKVILHFSDLASAEKSVKKRTQFFSNCKMGMPSSKFVFYTQLSKNLSTLTNQCVFLLAIRKFSWYELYLGRLQNFSLNNLNRKSLLEYRPFALASFHDFPRLLSHATGCYFPSELLGGGSSSCLPTKFFLIWRLFSVCSRR